jgi:hypothetical protein
MWFKLEGLSSPEGKVSFFNHLCNRWEEVVRDFSACLENVGVIGVARRDSPGDIAPESASSAATTLQVGNIPASDIGGVDFDTCLARDRGGR